MPDTPTPDTIVLPRFGDRLPNGTIVVEYLAVTPTFGIVLAHRDHDRSPWCVWIMHPERWDSTNDGSYKATLLEAATEMNRRKAVWS